MKRTMVTRSKPFHVHSRLELPFHLYQPSFEAAWVCGSAGQIARPWSELRKDELREEEFIQVGYLSLRSEGPPLRWPLVVKAEVKPASLLRTEVFICKCDTGDESASIALDDAWSGAIHPVLSQRSAYNSGALDVPKSQPRHSAQVRILASKQSRR